MSVEIQNHVKGTEPYFRDHFPGFPVVPGVLLVEMMAQAAGLCIYSQDRDRGIPLLAKLTNAVFRDWVKPEQSVMVQAKVQTTRLEFASAGGSVRVDGREFASASMLFKFVSRAQFEGHYLDEVLARTEMEITRPS